jgi:DNA-binding Lrp family transcriptional regulator
MIDLDFLDRKIMYELDLNARISASDLAKKLLKSKETVNFRINRLLEKNIIKRFYTVFNSSKLGWFYLKIYIKFRNITPEKEKELFEYIEKQGNIAYLGCTKGRYDCIVLVMVKKNSDMLKFSDTFMKLYGDYVAEKDIVTFLTTHRFNQRLFFEGSKNNDWAYQLEIENYEIDETDRKILDILSKNARTPLMEIAKDAGVDHKVVKYRIKKLEKDNIILAYVGSPNFDALGLTFYQINISLKDPTVRKQVIEFFSSTNRCLFAMELLGRYDCLAEIHVNSNQDLKNIVDEFRVKFADKYYDYDILTIDKEYVVVWSPFS